MARGRHHPTIAEHQRSLVITGALLVGVAAVVVFLAMTKWNPLARPFKVVGVFKTANNLRTNSPVRIAGIDVGKVTKVSSAGSGGGARVEIEIEDKGLPIHSDATMKIRPRTFLEGNFFVDVKPGSPSAPKLGSGDVIPINQTATPVQIGDVLTALESDTREDLQTLLDEYAKALRQGGAQGFNQSIQYWKPAYRDTALANQAALGTDPAHDLHRLLRGQQRTFAALSADQNALRGLVTNFNTVAGALASQDGALEASVPALRDTLRAGQPSLRALDRVLPTLRAFSIEALPGVRSTAPALSASIPFMEQLRLLARPSELRGTARELRRTTPSLVSLTQRSRPLLTETRALSACTTRVLVPYINTPIPDPDFSDQNGQTVNEAVQHSMVGLAGESRLTDGNGSYFNTQALPPPPKVRPAPPPDGGHLPPPHRPDVPCETQEPPNLEAPGGLAATFPPPPTAGLPGGITPPSLPLPLPLRQALQRARPQILRALGRRANGGTDPKALSGAGGQVEAGR